MHTLYKQSLTDYTETLKLLGEQIRSEQNRSVRVTNESLVLSAERRVTCSEGDSWELGVLSSSWQTFLALCLARGVTVW